MNWSISCTAIAQLFQVIRRRWEKSGHFQDMKHLDWKTSIDKPLNYESGGGGPSVQQEENQ